MPCAPLAATPHLLVPFRVTILGLVAQIACGLSGHHTRGGGRSENTARGATLQAGHRVGDATGLAANTSRFAKPSRPTPRGSYRMVLQNHEDVQYVGSFKIGSQNIRGVIDTGSFELLVFSADCAMCGERRDLYDHNKSSFFQRGELEMMHAFGSGRTWSHEGSDLVQIGPFEAWDQSFWEVFATAMPVLRTATFQAIVGLGPAESARKIVDMQAQKMEERKKRLQHKGKTGSGRFRRNYRASVVAADRAKQRLDLASNLNMHVFSICLGQELGDPGYFIWNDTDPRSYPPAVFTHIRSVGETHWSVELKNVHIGHGSHGDRKAVHIGCGPKAGPCGAVLDSGTSLIAAPREAIALVEQALKQVGGDCSKLDDFPDLHFEIGGSEFTLPPESYVGQVLGAIPPALREILHFGSHKLDEGIPARDGIGSICQPLLMAVDSNTQFGPMWILGLPFFRRYYTTFQTRPTDDGGYGRHRSISVALADENCSPSSGMSLLGSPRHQRRPLRVDASQLRVPQWVSDAVAKRRIAI